MDVLPAGQVAPAVNYRSSSVTAASGEVNANLEIVKNVKLIANTFFGSGNGRYVGTGLGPDVIVRADGSLSPVHSYSTVDGFEANVSKNTLLSMLYGGALLRPKCSAGHDRKADWLWILWFKRQPEHPRRNYRYRADPCGKTKNYGDLKLIGQYSYLWRDPWSYGITGAAPARNARTNMYFIDLRYELTVDGAGFSHATHLA